MTSLPRELAHWEGELAAFPHDLALALGAWMGSLHAAIGPWAQAQDHGGEPDGLGALARRGPYDRLLASEWLLADEMPDEFLRRAASSEHLFLARTYAAQKGRRHAIALFDAGPSQFGAPRIAHLALLFVLHRRALQADARFSWGVLQRPADGLRDTTDVAAVRSLLDARTASEPSEAHLDAWREAIEGGDLWLVGGRRARAFGAAARGVVHVEDPIEIARTALDVEVVQQSRRVALELRLPEDATCARLVRDPFRVGASLPSTGTVSRAGRLALPGDGRRLVVTGLRTCSSWGLPNSSRGGTGAPRVLEVAQDEQLIAVGHRGRKVFGVAVKRIGKHSRLVLRRAPFADDDRPITIDDPDGAASRLAHLHHSLPIGHAVANVLSSSPTEIDLTFQAGIGRLVSVTKSTLANPVVWDDVVAWAPLYNGALLVVAEMDPARTRVKVLGRDGVDATLVEHAGFTTPLALAGSTELDQAVVGYAIDETLRAFRLANARRSGASLELAAPEGTRVFGVRHDSQSGPSLLVVDRDRRWISVLGRSKARQVVRASGEITSAVAAMRGDVVAWRTDEGWIEVASMGQASILLRIPPDESGR